MNKIDVNLEFYDRLHELIDDAYVSEGVLLDSAIFYGTEGLILEGIELKEYTILESKYVNCWTSRLELSTTDDISYVSNWEQELRYNGKVNSID